MNIWRDFKVSTERWGMIGTLGGVEAVGVTVTSTHQHRRFDISGIVLDSWEEKEDEIPMDNEHEQRTTGYREKLAFRDLHCTFLGYHVHIHICPILAEVD